MARVLIIDDDDDIIDHLTMVLERGGHTVTVKRDTAAVAAAVAAAAPQVIILDVNFPPDPYAGYKAARAIHADEQLARIPILMLSAVNQPAGPAYGFADSGLSPDFLPPEAFIEKPIEPKALLALIDRTLAR